MCVQQLVAEVELEPEEPGKWTSGDEERREGDAALLVEFSRLVWPDTDGIIAGAYFSFPSFEDFQDYREAGDRRDGRLEKGVP
jgi:hypothetical protein